MTNEETAEERKMLYILLPLKAFSPCFYEQEAPHFHFVMGPENYMADPAQGLISAQVRGAKRERLSVHSGNKVGREHQPRARLLQRASE